MSVQKFQQSSTMESIDGKSVYSFSLSGTDLNLSEIQDQLSQLDVKDISVIDTPNDKSITVTLENPTEDQLNDVQKIFKPKIGLTLPALQEEQHEVNTIPSIEREVSGGSLGMRDPFSNIHMFNATPFLGWGFGSMFDQRPMFTWRKPVLTQRTIQQPISQRFTQQPMAQQPLSQQPMSQRFTQQPMWQNNPLSTLSNNRQSHLPQLRNNMSKWDQERLNYYYNNPDQLTTDQIRSLIRQTQNV